ncbi:cytosine permease [soil metagenome]
MSKREHAGARRSGNETGEGVLHDYALAAVPIDNRRGVYQMTAVWMGWCISISAFLVGGAIGAGTTFGEGMAAIVLGNVALALVGGLVGYVGYRTGLTTYLVSHILFGVRGSIVPSVILGVLAMGFIGVLMDAFGGAITALVPGLNWTAVVLLFALLVTVTAIFGFRGLAALSSVAVPAMFLLAALGLIRIATSEGGFSTVLAAAPEEPIGFRAAVAAVIAVWITGAALACDIGRYARNSKLIVIGAVAGYVLGAGFFETAATLTAMEVGDPNFVVVMSGLGLLLPAAIVLALALWTTTDNNLYSASLAFTNASDTVGRTVPKWVWVLVSIAIATGTAFLGFAQEFLSWLQIIATVTPPFAGILIAHFFAMGGIRQPVDRQLEALPAVRVEALAAWLLASLFNYYTDVFIAPLTGVIVGGVLYVAFSFIARKLGSDDRAASGTEVV